MSPGTLNDLVGAAGTAMMIPVALAFGPRRVRRLGLAAMGALTVAGPLLVVGALPTAVHLPIVLAAYLALAGWILLTSRQLPGSVFRTVARLGVLCGAGVLAGATVAGIGMFLPAMSAPQLVVLGIGGVPAALATLAIPVWFLLLGRALRFSAAEIAVSAT